MTTLDQYINGLFKLVSLDDFIYDMIGIMEPRLLELIKTRLYRYGLDGDGNLIGEYTESSKARKKELRQLATHITLRNTGKFYKGMYAEMDGGTLLIDSTDSKTEMLTGVYGEAILGLTEQEQEWLIDNIIDIELQKYVNSLGDQISGGPDASGEAFSAT